MNNAKKNKKYLSKNDKCYRNCHSDDRREEESRVHPHLYALEILRFALNDNDEGINLLKHFDSLFLVLLNLQDEFVYGVELCLGTKEIDEFNAHRLVVDVAFEVQDMNLDT